MIRRPPRSTLDRSSAASDVYKRQVFAHALNGDEQGGDAAERAFVLVVHAVLVDDRGLALLFGAAQSGEGLGADRAVDLDAVRGLEPVSYTHLRAHETVLDLVCRLLLGNNKH